ncbi:MAG: DHA2 family efflux MFS transporter permease subunit, partial [Thermomicrobia bacterium]|nr:DHA2 family efflux MFS transporter permease subunit [Thermomicrobia bacterium]
MVERAASEAVNRPAETAEYDDGYKWRVLFSVIFGTFMSILDNTVVNVALATLQKDFRASISHTQGIVTYYALSLGIVIPVAGFLADRFGIKRVYVFSLVAFTAASALCGLAPSLNTLILFRILQGLGGGALLPLGTAMLFAAFPPNERGLALSVFGIPSLVAPALGPTLGGFLVEYVDWRFIFYINLPIGIVGALIASRNLRERRSEARARFDLPGFILSTIGFGALLYGLSHAATDGWTSKTVLGFLGLGIVTLAAFVVVELRSPHPLLNVRFYQKPIYLLASAVGWVSVVALFGATFLLPLYFQTLRGRTPFQTGLLLLPQAVAAVIAIQISGRMYDRIGPRYVVTLGLIGLALTTWGFTQITETTSYVLICAQMAVRGFALACVMQPTQAAALSVIERDVLTRASSLLSVMRSVFQSLGVAILGTVLQLRGTPATGFRGAYTIVGYRDAYNVALGAAIIGVVLAAFLPIKPRRPAEAAATRAEPQPVAHGAE